MTVFIGESRVSMGNFFNRNSLISLDITWPRIESLLAVSEDKKRLVYTTLCEWINNKDDVYRFENLSQLAQALAIGAKRENKFFNEGGENNNVAPVVYQSRVPQSSIGWTQRNLFEELGHHTNTPYEDERESSKSMAAEAIKANSTDKDKLLQGLKRRAEQEYLLQNMAKGPMVEAAKIADTLKVGIAVRGTGLLAHMGIESGAATKAQEFKNKTSKEVDLWLCEELPFCDLGAVVHYDPRVGWTSKGAQAFREKYSLHFSKKIEFDRKLNFLNNPQIEGELKNLTDVEANQYLEGLLTKKSSKPEVFTKESKESLLLEELFQKEWLKKYQSIKDRKAISSRSIDSNLRGLSQPSEKVLYDAFKSRLTEFWEEDHEYRHGHYKDHTLLVGPFIRLRLRPDENMYGDHDLFVFTKGDSSSWGVISIADLPNVQAELQNANTFQAQHGAIWYWAPGTAFNSNIKEKIMSAHSPNDGDPLVYIRPDGEITAAFFIKGIEGAPDRLDSVWDHYPAANKWLMSTYSGKLLVEL